MHPIPKGLASKVITEKVDSSAVRHPNGTKVAGSFADRPSTDCVSLAVSGNGAMVKVKTAQGPLDKAALRIPSCTKMGAITNAVQKWEFLGSTRPNT